MKTAITRGFVMVYVPEHDDEGTQRTIDFPYVGKVLHGTPLLHQTCRKYLREATLAAKSALHAAYLEAEYDRIAMS